MRFDLTPDQERFREATRAFAQGELRSRNLEAWPGLCGRMAALGLFGVAVPRDLGGAGLDHVSLAVAVEELAAESPSAAAFVSAANALFCEPLLRFGTPLQQREALAQAAAGDALGCFALAEGTHDDGPMHATATRGDDGSFVLDGEKRFVALGPDAARALVIATSDRTPIALLVPRTSAGYSRSPEAPRLGDAAPAAGALRFEKVRVPADQQVGDEGGAVADAALEAGRACVAAQAVGIARGAFERAAAHVKDRLAASSKGALQSVEFSIADMATEIDAARLLVHRASALLDRGGDAAGACAMAALFASEMAVRVTHRALEAFGRHGGTEACEVERYHRAALAARADAGASDELRATMASLPGGLGAGAPHHDLSRGSRSRPQAPVSVGDTPTPPGSAGTR
jgi:butyryl-CoA dehydrogenase